MATVENVRQSTIDLNKPYEKYLSKTLDSNFIFSSIIRNNTPINNQKFNKYLRYIKLKQIPLPIYQKRIYKTPSRRKQIPLHSAHYIRRDPSTGKGMQQRVNSYLLSTLCICNTEAELKNHPWILGIPWRVLDVWGQRKGGGDWMWSMRVGGPDIYYSWESLATINYNSVCILQMKRLTEIDSSMNPFFCFSLTVERFAIVFVIARELFVAFRLFLCFLICNLQY